MQILTILMNVAILAMGFYFLRIMSGARPSEFIILAVLITYTWGFIADLDLMLMDIDLLGILSLYPPRGIVYKIPMVIGLGFAIRARVKERAQLGHIHQHTDRSGNTSIGGRDHRDIRGMDKVFGDEAKARRA